MDSIIDHIKTATNLPDLIGQSFTITGRGRTLTTAEHDSLKIWTDTNTWHWFSQSIGGDCLDWYQHIHNCTLPDAIDALAARANIERRPLSPEEQAQRTHQQAHHRILALAAAHYHKQFLHHPAADAARAYCASRAWTQGTIAAEMIGCTLPSNAPLPHCGGDRVGVSGDNNALSADLPSPGTGEGSGVGVPLAAQLRAANLLDHPTARAVLSIPPDMLIYVHRAGGQITYLSARSITGKRHYNLPQDLAGPKQPYHNHNSQTHNPQLTLLVEGQADAISLAQLSIPAIALCGADLPSPKMGEGSEVGVWAHITHIALDADDAGRKKALDIAQSLNPLLPIIEWQPIASHPVKDANDALVVGAQTSHIIDLAETARPALLHLAETARRLTGDLRTEAQRAVLDAYLTLDPLIAADLKPQLADALNTGIGQLNRMIKARQEEQEEEAKSNPTESAQRDKYSAGGYIGGHLIEQFVEWDSTGEPFAYYYIRYPDGHIDRCASITIGGTCYMPINPMDDENISKKTVLFPSALGHYDSECQLIADIRAFLHKWFDMSPAWERITSYYVLFTWFYDAGFETIPYLRALGDYGTGKTRYIESAGHLCYRPMLISGGDSEAIIFRMIDDYRGTMIVDEAQFSDSNANTLIAQMINLGNRITGNIKRLEGDNGSYKRKVFMVFCPKIFAARYEFGDDAMGSRCLTQYMVKSDPRHGVPLDTDPSFRSDAQAIRNKLAHYRLQTWKPVVIDHTLTDRTIMPRLAQITIALRTIIKDPEALAEMDTYIHIYNRTLIGERSMTDQAFVVQALAHIYYRVDQPAQLVDLGPDLTLANITKVAQKLMLDMDPDKKFNQQKLSRLLTQQLGLTGRGRDHRRDSITTVEFAEDQLRQLMARYGVKIAADQTKTEATEVKS